MPVILDHKELEKLARRKKARRLRAPKPSTKPERTLRRRLEALWKRVLFPATRGLKELIKQKASPSVIAETIDQVFRQAEFEYGLVADNYLTEWKLSLDRDTRSVFLRGLQDSLGVDVTALYDQPDIKDALTMGSTEAAGLIKTIPGDYLNEVARAVRMNFTGEPLPQGRSLIQQIEQVGKVSRGRAKVIARDQTKKLNTELNRHRQQAIGTEIYIWRTVRDQRVVGNPAGVSPKGSDAHKNHFVMEGKYCKWDDPTVYSTDKGKTWKKRTGEMPHNHPGQDIQCRCNAEPVIDMQRIIQYAEAA